MASLAPKTHSTKGGKQPAPSAKLASKPNTATKPLQMKKPSLGAGIPKRSQLPPKNQNPVSSKQNTTVRTFLVLCMFAVLIIQWVCMYVRESTICTICAVYLLYSMYVHRSRSYVFECSYILHTYVYTCTLQIACSVHVRIRHKLYHLFTIECWPVQAKVVSEGPQTSFIYSVCVRSSLKYS